MAPDKPWLAHYEPGVPRQLPELAGSFPAALATAAAGAPTYPALTFYNRTFSYAELDAMADCVAGALIRDGIERGDRVLVALPNSPLFVAGCLGAQKAGGVAAPVSPDLDAAGIEKAVARSAPSFAIVAPRAARAVVEALGPEPVTVVVARSERCLPVLVRLVARLGGRRKHPRRRDLRGTVAWPDWLAGVGGPVDVAIEPDVPALLVAPSQPGEAGQTFTHRQLAAGAAQLRVWMTDAMPGDDTWLLLAPLWTSFGFVAALGTAMVLRARVVLLPGWETRDVIDTLRYLRPTYVVTGREAAARLAEDALLARADLRSVRAWLATDLVTGGTVRAFEELAGVSLCRGFAPEGVAGLVLCNPINGTRSAGSVGVPLPGVDVRLAGTDGAAVPPGEAGYLAISGPNVSSDGWLQTDVVAHMDDAGFVYAVPP